MRRAGPRTLAKAFPIAFPQEETFILLFAISMGGFETLQGGPNERPCEAGQDLPVHSTAASRDPHLPSLVVRVG